MENEKNHSHISEEEKNEIERILKEKLKNLVEIEVILDYENNEEFSHLTEHICRELSELNQNLKFNFHFSNEEKTKEIIKKHNLILNSNFSGPILFYKEYPNIIHYGFPLQREFVVFLEELEFISSKQLVTQLNVAQKISKINESIDILVFVTSTCPYCPIMSLSSHKFAYLNKNIRGIVIESEQFPSLTEKFEVFAVPKIIILKDDEIKDEFEGAVTEEEFAEYVLKASKD